MQGVSFFSGRKFDIDNTYVIVGVVYEPLQSNPLKEIMDWMNHNNCGTGQFHGCELYDVVTVGQQFSLWFNCAADFALFKMAFDI